MGSEMCIRDRLWPCGKNMGKMRFSVGWTCRRALPPKTGMAKSVGIKRRAEEGVTVRISCDNDFLRRAEICVGVIAHGKMKKLQFCGMAPQEGAAARGWND